MAEVANVDPVEPQYRPQRRKRAGRPAGCGCVDFLKASGPTKTVVSASPPVVEIARDHEWRIGSDFGSDQFKESLNLVAAMRLAQREVYANRVQRGEAVRPFNDRVQESPRLGTADRCVDVPPGGNRKLRQQRVSVMSRGRNRVPSVCILTPDAVREHLVLPDCRIRARRSADFLEEYQVGPRGAERAADAKQGLVTMSGVEALVSVQRQYAYPGCPIAARPRFHAPKLYREA